MLAQSLRTNTTELNKKHRQYPQIRRSSKFTNTSDNWPVRETVSNRHNYFWHWITCFAEYFVVMKNLTRPIFGLPFMRHNIVVIDTTHSLIHFPHLTRQFKTREAKRVLNPKLFSITNPNTTTNDNEKNHSLCWSSIRKEHNLYFDSTGESHWNSNSAVFPLNVNNKKSSSQSN